MSATTLTARRGTEVDGTSTAMRLLATFVGGLRCLLFPGVGLDQREPSNLTNAGPPAASSRGRR